MLAVWIAVGVVNGLLCAAFYFAGLRIGHKWGFKAGYEYAAFEELADDANRKP